MPDDLQMIPIDDLSFTQHSATLPAELVDRITLIHHAFRDYLSSSLEETINNFKFDQDPESEVRVWEHMAQVVLILRYQDNWPQEKVKQAAKVVLGLSAGAIQGNTLKEADTQHIISLWGDRAPR